MPSSTVPSPYISAALYPFSTTCGAAAAAEVAANIYVSATCVNENRGGSVSYSSTGQATVYTLSGCTGVGVVNKNESVTLGCDVSTDDDESAYDDAVVASSLYVTYVSPAARWTVNAGLAAVLAAVACMAI